MNEALSARKSRFGIKGWIYWVFVIGISVYVIGYFTDYVLQPTSVSSRTYEIYMPSEAVVATGPIEKLGDKDGGSGYIQTISLESFKTIQFDRSSVWVNPDTGFVEYVGSWNGQQLFYKAHFKLEQAKTRLGSIQRQFSLEGNVVTVSDAKRVPGEWGIGICFVLFVFLLITYFLWEITTKQRYATGGW